MSKTLINKKGKWSVFDRVLKEQNQAVKYIKQIYYPKHM